MNKHKEVYMVIDLYDDKLHNDRDDLIKKYQDLITWSKNVSSLGVNLNHQTGETI
jgi:hypothetical protein